MKTCARCGEAKPLEDFSPDKRARDGRYGACKACNKVAAKVKRDADPTAHRQAVRKWKAKPENAESVARSVREWHERNPEAHLQAQRRYDAQRRYGISVDEYEERLKGQRFCAICGTENPGTRGFHLDHDHETGQVREFLCGACNMGLGQFGDDPDRLLAAAMYLMRHKNTLGALLPGLAEG